jgi:hypothetical protein
MEAATLIFTMDSVFGTGLFESPFFNLFPANGVTTLRDLPQGSPPRKTVFSLAIRVYCERGRQGRRPSDQKRVGAARVS